MLNQHAASNNLFIWFFQTQKLQVVESAGIKFPDLKNSGVSLRSQRIKLPSSLGQKKMKGIEQMLNELQIGNYNTVFIE